LEACPVIRGVRLKREVVQYIPDKDIRPVPVRDDMAVYATEPEPGLPGKIPVAEGAAVHEDLAAKTIDAVFEKLRDVVELFPGNDVIVDAPGGPGQVGVAGGTRIIWEKANYNGPRIPECQFRVYPFRDILFFKTANMAPADLPAPDFFKIEVRLCRSDPNILDIQRSAILREPFLHVASETAAVYADTAIVT
jgi:hypothetical protein